MTTINRIFLIIAWAGISSTSMHSSAIASTAKNPVQANNNLNRGASSEQQLQRCLTLARQGDVDQAVSLAYQTRMKFSSQRLFDVNYMDTLISIAVNHPSKHNGKIVNEVVRVVNDLKNQPGYSGSQDAELAYHFMVALGRLSTLTMGINKSVAATLEILEGTIARNLQSNSNYPKNALEALAQPMVKMAHGYAIKNDQAGMFDALRNAVDVGYSDFRSIVVDSAFSPVATKTEFADLVIELDSRYEDAAKSWGKTAIADFEPFPFRFNIAGIDGTRIKKSDFRGRVIVVDLWATWCAPCRKGIPHYIRLQKEYDHMGVSVLGISMDNIKNPDSAIATVRQFMTEQNFNYPSGMGTESIAAQIPGKTTYPTTLFLDRSGAVRFVATGYHDFAKIKAITDLLARENQSIKANSPDSISN